MMKLTLGFSTCPNDTFIFDAMIHDKIDTEGLKFDLVIEDVEELNKATFEGNIDITKLSYHAFAFVADKYKLLTAGSALGRKNGPLLISRKKIYQDEVNDLRIAIPGKYTTANLLFSIAYPKVKEKKTYLFSDIEEAILEDEVDAGVIIHENRFTYQKKGLRKVVDLGELWEEKTGNPIPLGGIVVNRNIEPKIQQKVNRILRKSVEFAFENPQSSREFVKRHAQELDDSVIDKHIDLYVNDFSVNLGNVGKKAIKRLYEEATKAALFESVPKDIFVF